MKLKIGNDEIEFVTAEDIAPVLQKLDQSQQIMQKLLSQKTYAREPASFQADAAGVVGGGTIPGAFTIYTAPANTMVRITRISVDAAGFTAAVPLAIGYLSFCVGGDIQAFSPTTFTATAPFIYEASNDNTAIFLKPNEDLKVFGSGFAASQTFSVSMNLILEAC